MSSSEDAAARLCAACGMCCNGVLFHSVVLQPGDKPRQLSALGLKVKLRQGQRFFLQPCAAHQDCRCTIYADRPERCRKFVCRQLAGMLEGSISEIEAMNAVGTAGALTAEVMDLLRRAGDDRAHRPLASRCAAVFTPPLDPSDDAVAIRADLRKAMEALEGLLASNFRVE